MKDEKDMTDEEIHHELLRRGITEVSLEKAQTRVIEALRAARVQKILHDFNIEFFLKVYGRNQ